MDNQQLKVEYFHNYAESPTDLWYRPVFDYWTAKKTPFNYMATYYISAFDD